MKHYFTREKPDCLIEDWPGKYDIFSWLEFGITVPNPIYLITSYKENDIPNGNLQSWGLLLGEGKQNHFLMAILKHQHTYANIKRTGEWCVNYLSKDFIRQVNATINNNDKLTDELTASGLTVIPSRIIHAPSVDESMVTLECKLKWEQSLVDDSKWGLVCGEIVQVAIEDAVLAVKPEERIAAMGLMYNIRGTVNPLNGEYHGPNTYGLIGDIIHYLPGTDEFRT